MILRKLLLFLLAVFFPIFIAAEEVTREQIETLAEKLAVQKLTVTTRQNLAEFYQWFNIIGDPRNPMTMEDIEDFFMPDAFMLSNGKIVAKGYKELFIYLQALRANYKLMKVLLPFQDTVISDTKASVRYIIDAIVSDEQHFKVYVIAILKFSGNRVIEFSEVTYKDPIKTAKVTPNSIGKILSGNASHTSIFTGDKK